jgi:hypothetical protein
MLVDWPILIGFSVIGVFADEPITPPKSNALPGVFGVFEDPNDANAPDPKPKALDAPVVGDTRDVVGGALKGFLLL